MVRDPSPSSPPRVVVSTPSRGLHQRIDRGADRWGEAGPRGDQCSERRVGRFGGARAWQCWGICWGFDGEGRKAAVGGCHGWVCPDCKSVIPRFKSGCRLQPPPTRASAAQGLVGLEVGSCAWGGSARRPLASDRQWLVKAASNFLQRAGSIESIGQPSARERLSLGAMRIVAMPSCLPAV